MTLLTFWKRFISCRGPQLFRSELLVQVLDVTLLVKARASSSRKIITASFSFRFSCEMHLDRPINKVN
jgi:hypothetical protein